MICRSLAVSRSAPARLSGAGVTRGRAARNVLDQAAFGPIPKSETALRGHGAGRLSIRVTPNASADAIIVPTGDGILQVRTTATPEGGKANEAVLKLLAAALGQPVSALELLRGSGVSHKTGTDIR